ncbi:hypothetical protein Nepgr_004554 [Nepenthes gracilis]|uniref:HTH myb-type domain-containing protein n=1 Tax=Nepenthes gracilis TaxID=150966 RepID=A0AAD3XFE6_NEPGR|nr:hypothetical protein Nepgr_004554 [Nepenthes gracilis]
MGLIAPALSLGFKPSCVPGTINGFLSEVSKIGDVSERLDKVEDLVRRLEEELGKIEVFKRELPLCMLLLNDAIVVLKEESVMYRSRNPQPVLEEFIPLKKESSDHSKLEVNEESRNKKNWMSSVQLWHTDIFPPDIQQYNGCQNLVSEIDRADEKRNRFSTADVPESFKSKVGRRRLPIKEYSNPTFPMSEREANHEDLVAPGISLLMAGKKHHKEETDSQLGVASSPASSGHSNLRSRRQQPTARKQRRCWSPDLHRRFVNALQHLGGAQVATPKQIRELMQVDGLTNDEVKSHLQKYRLHTGRVSSISAPSPDQSCPNQNSEFSKPSSSHSGSPQGALYFGGACDGSSIRVEDAKVENPDS